MPCEHVQFPGGGTAIVCSSRRRKPKPCACGSGLPATQRCDWKVPARHTGTCDAWLCEACTHIPAPDKDLCPKHAAEWKSRPRKPAPEGA